MQGHYFEYFQEWVRIKQACVAKNRQQIKQPTETEKVPKWELRKEGSKEPEDKIAASKL